MVSGSGKQLFVVGDVAVEKEFFCIKTRTLFHSSSIACSYSYMYIPNMAHKHFQKPKHKNFTSKKRDKEERGMERERERINKLINRI
jgi:hypothetical protein